MAYDLGAVKPHVAAAANEVGPKFGISTVLGKGERTTPGSDHPKGLALDFMVRGSRGTSLAEYVRANARRLAVTYVIWQQRIWSTERDAEGWRQMADRGDQTANHFDHVHVSFGASGRPGSPTLPTVPGIEVDQAAVAGLLDPLPGWFGDKLRERLDATSAGMIRALTGMAIAGVLIAGGAALVVSGMAIAATRARTRRENDE